MWSGNLKTALAILRANRWRSILTMLGIIIGVSSVVTVVSLGEGLKQQVVGRIGQLGSDVITVRTGKLLSDSGPAGNLNLLAFLNTSTLTVQDVAAINKLPSVSGVVPIDFVTNTVGSGTKELNDVFVIGTSPYLPDLLHQKINFGDFFGSEQSNQNVAVIGSAVAEQLFGQLNPVGHSFKIMGNNFLVSGVLAASSGGLLSVAETDFNSAVFIPLPIAQSLTSNRANILQILAKSRGGDVDQTVADIENAVAKSHGGARDFSVLKQDQLLGLVSGVLNVITSFISGIAAISLLVGGIGIMDIMLVSVSERTREIGVRKAVGATNRQILNQFLTEGLALTISGGLIGIIVSLLINLALRVYTNLHPVITLWVMGLAVGVSVAVGIIFSVAPALKAARKNPIDALRGE